MALVMVIAVMATASILAYALLESSSLQASISGNLANTANSEYIAESGINIATYYLQNPALAPASWTSTSGYLLHATAVPLNDGTSAAFDVSVSSTTTRDVFTLSSTGYTSTASPLTHAVTARVTVNRAKIPAAGVFGGNIAIPAGATFSSGSITGGAAIQANGTISTSGSLIGTLLGTVRAAPLPSTSYVAPTATNVNYYGVGMPGGVYLYTDGTTLGTPQQITAATLNSANLPTLSPNNPAAIFYHNGNLAISSNLAFAGTLVVRGGNLTISAGNTTITINPRPKFPALLCEQNLTYGGRNSTLTINGVVFLGTGFAWSGGINGSQCRINGALVLPGGKTIGSSATGSLAVTYTPSTIDVPGLTQFDQPGVNIKANTWSQ
jgi:hypothetical protein